MWQQMEAFLYVWRTIRARSWFKSPRADLAEQLDRLMRDRFLTGWQRLNKTM